jgi:hypothetical protein
MRLPAHLLHQLSVGLRVGVGVGAVLLAGCDLVDEVKSAVGGESETVAVAERADDADAAKTPEAAAPKAGGLAGKVAQAIDEAKPEPLPEPRLEPLLDLPKAPERETSSPRAEPEDVTAFVPFGEPSGRTPTRIKPRSKARPIERPLAIAPDEPCDPALSPVLGSAPPDRDPCPACGRG